MIKKLRFILLLTVVSVHVLAQDSISVTNRLLHNRKPITNLSSAGEYNPAAKVFSQERGLSELILGYRNQSGNAALTQKANDYENYRFEAHSYMSMGVHHLWGKASYNNTHSDKIRWNESSDYDNIYPYVFADTIGGNNLIGERYSFLGGYAMQGKKLSFGVSLSYWALMEYRKVDPRPNNNTSNLKIDLGTNYKLFSNYAIGVGGFIRKYKQSNTIAFGNVLGRKTSLHHMTGLGNEAYLFANSEKESMFDGHGYGVNGQVLSLRNLGFNATFGYEHFSFEKQVKSDQNQILPLALVDEDKFVTQITYSTRMGKSRLGAKLDASYTNRKGTENKFTKDDNGSFLEIASDQVYGNKLTDVNLTLIYEYQASQICWYINPQIYFYDKQEKHTTSSNKINVSKLGFGLTPGIIRPFGKNILQIDANLGYFKTLDSSIKINNISAEKTLYQSLMNDYDYLSSNLFQAKLSARFDYLLTGTNMALFAKGTFNYAKYDSLHSNYMEVNLGIVF